MFFKKLFIKKYRKRLKKLKSKQKNSLQKEREKFICILQHDIKTPILAQNQSLELVLNNYFGEISKAQREILKEIYNSNNFLLETVSNSLFLTKYENDNKKLNLENVKIIEETKECLELIKHFAKIKNQNIILKNKKEINIFADRKLTQKIIYNLLTSSISSGNENTQIEVSIEEKNNEVSFTTKNSSIYMTKEKLNSLFEEKKNLRDFNQLGMNLNLNIAKKLIKAHNWDVIAESRKDNSSTFGFLVKKS